MSEDDPVTAARETVIEAMENSAELYGINRSYGRLYGILFFQHEPMSLDALVEESGFAKSTVSTAMKTMDRLHLVHRRSIPGEGKKAFYEAETDFWQIIQAFLRHEAKRELDIMTTALDDAERRLEGADDERAARDLERIRSLRETYDRFETILDVLTSSSLEKLAGLVRRLRGSD